jgi:hypothetical protein
MASRAHWGLRLFKKSQAKVNPTGVTTPIALLLVAVSCSVDCWGEVHCALLSWGNSLLAGCVCCGVGETPALVKLAMHMNQSIINRTLDRSTDSSTIVPPRPAPPPPFHSSI